MRIRIPIIGALGSRTPRKSTPVRVEPSTSSPGSPAVADSFPSRRRGGSLGRRTEAAAGAEGAGRTGVSPERKSSRVRSRTAQGRGGVPVRSGRWSPAIPARGAQKGLSLRASPTARAQSKTVRAERSSFAETHIPYGLRAKARTLRPASHSPLRVKRPFRLRGTPSKTPVFLAIPPGFPISSRCSRSLDSRARENPSERPGAARSDGPGPGRFADRFDDRPND